MAWNTLDGVSLFVARETLGTQCNTLVQFHVITDDAGRTDYDTRTVVNGKMMSDLRRKAVSTVK